MPGSQVTVTTGLYKPNLATNRSLTKFILLGIVTFGIYMTYVIAQSGEDLNTMAARLDGKKTMNYWLMAYIVGPLTLGIGTLVWYNNFSGRIGTTMSARGMEPKVNASTWWLWGFLGILILVGPFVYFYKVLHAMNELCESYNEQPDMPAVTVVQTQMA